MGSRFRANLASTFSIRTPTQIVSNAATWLSSQATRSTNALPDSYSDVRERGRDAYGAGGDSSGGTTVISNWGPYVDPDVYQLFLRGLSVDEALEYLQSIMTRPVRASILRNWIVDSYRTAVLLEQTYLLRPDFFVPEGSQGLCPLPLEIRAALVEQFYSFDPRVMKELLGKKLSSRTRKDLEDIALASALKQPVLRTEGLLSGLSSGIGAIHVGGCRRMFDNLKRITRRVEDMEGDLVTNITRAFCLNRDLSTQYALVIFINALRFDTTKKKLHHMKFLDFINVAAVLNAHWTAPPEATTRSAAPRPYPLQSPSNPRRSRASSLGTTAADQVTPPSETTIPPIPEEAVQAPPQEAESPVVTVVPADAFDVTLAQDCRDLKTVFSSVKDDVWKEMRTAIARWVYERHSGDQMGSETSDQGTRDLDTWTDGPTPSEPRPALSSQPSEHLSNLGELSQSNAALPMQRFNLASRLSGATSSRPATPSTVHTSSVTLPNLDYLRSISRAVIALGSSLSSAKEMRDALVTFYEKIVEPAAKAGMSAKDLEAVLAAIGGVYDGLESVNANYRKRYGNSWRRLFRGASEAAPHFFKKNTSAQSALLDTLQTASTQLGTGDGESFMTGVSGGMSGAGNADD